jgi:phage shock protein B
MFMSVNLLSLGVVLLFCFLFMCLLFFPIWGCIMFIRSPWAKDKQSTRNSEIAETRLIQEMHQGFVRMEERIEALETILMEQERKRERSL